jgi:hypothetical protein
VGCRISPKVMLMPLAMPRMLPAIDMRPVYDGLWQIYCTVRNLVPVPVRTAHQIAHLSN